MTYRPDTIKILRDFTESLIFPINIKTVVDHGDGTFTLYVCKLLHAQPGFSITIEDNNYLITNIDDDENTNTITVSGTAPITIRYFELYKPYFFYGTPIQTGMELNKESEVNIPHTPMVYFNPGNDGDMNDLDPQNKLINGGLFWLTNSNNLEWLNEDSYKYGVRPMRRLGQYYIDQMIEIGFSIFNILPANKMFRIDDYPKFGVYITEKGHVQNKWTDQLGGCGTKIGDLGIWDDGLCHDC